MKGKNENLRMKKSIKKVKKVLAMAGTFCYSYCTTVWTCEVADTPTDVVMAV